MAGSSLLFIFVTVFSSAAAASLGNKPIPVQNGSSCVVSDPFICESVGAPEGCPLEMKLTGLTMTGLTEYLTKAILEKHNQVRRKVAKGEYEFANQLNAANMKKLVWNEKLASSAQERVDQCNTNHSDGSFVGNDANETFQFLTEASFGRSWLLSDTPNTYMAVEDFEKIVQYWYDLIIIGGGNQTNFPFEISQTDVSWVGMTEPGPGSNLILAETEALGCGLAIYSRENWRMLEMLCYYDGPAERPASGPGYEVGPPCSSCQPGFSCDDGLCASGNPQVSTTESVITENGSTDSTADYQGKPEQPM